MSNGNSPNLLQFLESVPPPITLLLVELSTPISYVRHTLEFVSWKSHWTESWLALAGWWALCLVTHTFMRYLFPAVILLPALWAYLRSPSSKSSKSSPTTEQTLALVLADIEVIRSLLPTLPETPESLRNLPVALRVSAILYLPYVVLTYFVPLSILVGIAGTIVSTYRAPWASTLRTTLWRSAYVKRGLRYVWNRITGVHPGSAFQASTASVNMGPSIPSPAPPQRFLFTILECQRWWVGLDWTAALLPGERPSWCNVAQQPMSPPSAFTLPPSSIIYLPGRNEKRIKRTATWRWEEPQWGVIVNKDGAGVKRVEQVPPGIEEDNKDGNYSLKRAATILRERSIAASEKEENVITTVANVPDAEDTATDADGWVYGDNKWEAPTSKGGLGKFTRYRRWSRVAILEETVEEVEPGPLGILKDPQSLVKGGQGVVKEAQVVVTDAVALADMKSTTTRTSPERSMHSRSNSRSSASGMSPTVTDNISISSATSSPSAFRVTEASQSQEDPSNALRERLKTAIKNAR
ncbi:hypothetical protein M422DRAFT_161366 [Sphaerobolus stellatus SS14]|nr:hypothetical protein M422DRAFT_161366 [Sphaerobolus stellatus SS14]